LLWERLPRLRYGEPACVDGPSGFGKRSRAAAMTAAVRPERGFEAAYPGRPMDMSVASPAACEVCGNEYEMAFEVRAQGAVHVFDSFECAIHALAPVCEHCACRVIGHGVQANGRFYCCAHCARQAGAEGIRDHS
jgi:hypothetical protein